jgi:hypothetical protein
MSELTIPSLVIYPIGGDSIEHKGWGDILLDMLTNREAMGKPTWILKSKEFSKCQEVASSEKLRYYLTTSSTIPNVDLGSGNTGGDDADFVVDKKIVKGNTVVKTGSYSL